MLSFKKYLQYKTWEMVFLFQWSLLSSYFGSCKVITDSSMKDSSLMSRMSLAALKLWSSE